MDINATLFGQMITFAIFIWFTVKFVWPPLMKAMEDRRNKIADGLAAAEQGVKELELARIKSEEAIKDAKTTAAHIIEQANQRSHHIVEEAKTLAREEGERLLQIAKTDVEQEYHSAREKLMQEVSNIAVVGAERILKKEIDKSSNDRIISDLVGSI